MGTWSGNIYIQMLAAAGAGLGLILLDTPASTGQATPSPS